MCPVLFHDCVGRVPSSKTSVDIWVSGLNVALNCRWRQRPDLHTRRRRLFARSTRADLLLAGVERREHGRRRLRAGPRRGLRSGLHAVRPVQWLLFELRAHLRLRGNDVRRLHGLQCVTPLPGRLHLRHKRRPLGLHLFSFPVSCCASTPTCPNAAVQCLLQLIGVCLPGSELDGGRR